MKHTLLLIACLAYSVSVHANPALAYPDVLKIGAPAFWGKGTPMEKYGDGNPFMEWQPECFACQVRMWQIGSGVLVMEHTAGLVEIRKMSYVLRDKNDKIVAKLSVKEFNHVTEEMTIVVPNNEIQPTK